MDIHFQQISLIELNSVSQGDDTLKKELIEIFLEQIDQFSSNMKRFFLGNDMENLAKEAHTAKSSVLIFGMKETGTSLKEIQVQAENKKTEKLLSLIQKVELEMKTAARELKEITGNL